MALKRIHKKLAELQRDPPPGCTAAPIGADYSQWTGTIEGPPDTPYSGGVFKVVIVFPADYPFKAPLIYFTTRIFHPNISRSGTICLDTLTYNWSASLSIGKVLMSIQQLMADPNPSDPLDGTSARMFRNNRVKYNKTAQQWTREYAYPPPGYVFTTTQTTTSPANNEDSTGSGGSTSSW
ncbi:unnamed protein product [Medioppia subpectinata]|uniref:E2 ubiquitin-conjugating enzyme n=1 Tax=Medioppia subpectinata TaxID=1979941 RepID=A0A7R9LI98_9ACAR|nr:unnamed protein product [Medioppia subpectinata]CAG2119066.1 unnamed protein product [Medioppia subpectinata]